MEPMRAARRVLVAAAIIHLYFAVNECRGQLRGLAGGAPSGPILRGYDGHGYYAWLRSLSVDGDWQFGNEFDTFRATQTDPGAELSRTPTGRVMNQWSVGPALLWSITVVPVHMVVGGDGYSPAHQLAVAVATFAAGMLTLGLFFGIARQFAPPVPAACAAAVMTVGTSVVGYGSVELAMAHGPATAALAAFVFVWLRGFGEDGWRRWFVLGVLLGVAMLFRWQLVTFAVLPLMEAVWKRRAGGVVAFGVGGVVGFLPQMIAWQVVYGSPLVQPHGPAKNWLDPALAGVLLSADRGFFTWTPLTLVALVGLWLSPLPRRFVGGEGKRGGRARVRGSDSPREAPAPSPGVAAPPTSPPSEHGGEVKPRAAAMLFVAAVVQIYAMAAVYAPPVALGGSFGFRFLAETCAVLVPGVALLFARWRAAVLLALPLVLWNLLLLGVHRYAIGGDPLHAVGRYVALRPIDAVVVAGLWCGLAVVMVRRVELPREPASLAP